MSEHRKKMFIEYCVNGDVDNIKQELQSGLCPGFVLSGWSPMQSAAFNGHLSIVKLLTTYGADMHEVDGEGYTLPMCAIFSHYYPRKTPQRCIIQMLLWFEEHGAVMDTKSASGDSMLEIAAEYGCDQVLEYGFEKGWNINGLFEKYIRGAYKQRKIEIEMERLFEEHARALNFNNQRRWKARRLKAIFV